MLKALFSSDFVFNVTLHGFKTKLIQTIQSMIYVYSLKNKEKSQTSNLWHLKLLAFLHIDIAVSVCVSVCYTSP